MEEIINTGDTNTIDEVNNNNSTDEGEDSSTTTMSSKKNYCKIFNEFKCYYTVFVHHKN
jgi:hypothetical protein